MWEGLLKMLNSDSTILQRMQIEEGLNRKQRMQVLRLFLVLKLYPQKKHESKE